MMATTHALVGLLLASATFVFAPDLTPFAIAGAIAGGIAPDFDLLAGHRKTFHFPVYYSAIAAVTLVAAALAPTPMAVATGFFFLSAAAHSVMDAFGGGLELEPWRATSDRGVYNHYRGRWEPPRRWIRFDGAPEDFLLAASVGGPSVVLYGEPIPTVVLATLAVSGGYTLVRRRLVRIAERILGVFPERVVSKLPTRFVEPE